jgi:hypothetical protein
MNKTFGVNMVFSQLLQHPLTVLTLLVRCVVLTLAHAECGKDVTSVYVMCRLQNHRGHQYELQASSTDGKLS